MLKPLGCEWSWLSFNVLGRLACIVGKNLEIGKDDKNHVHPQRKREDFRIPTFCSQNYLSCCKSITFH